MAQASEEERQEQPIDLEITVHGADQAVAARACRLALGRVGDRWVSCQLQLRIAGPAWEDSRDQHFFGDSQENRLGGEDLEFDRSLPLWFELALRPDFLTLFPPPAEDGLAGVVNALSRPSGAQDPLFDQDTWRATQVWQEHPLDPSIGGGVLKVGYRTTWSPVRDTVDMLKRRGVLSRALVEAFIEYGLPVHFDADADALIVTMRAGERTYPCTVRADDAAIALEVTVALNGTVPKEAGSAVHAVLARINEDLPLGRFVLDAGTLRYEARIQTSEPLVNQGLVIESLRAAVSLMHQYAPDFLSLIHS